ncbi:penicillin acylase family protein [Chondrinema litorale]|uniref:penicillin acylase family protein n=1 Tax=Chondrinema litorale TaxID=2994555 RepID=UPI00254338B7|nr:penicillin acylase family protein [Chondrinema litorale]UZR94187.1 penicillin acylase family protein [Chondrinema litorale]
MKFFLFLIALVFNVALIVALNTGFSPIPPLGFFLSPTQGFWQNAENVNDTPDDDISMEGLKSEVSVIYDSALVPHVFAENDHDLYFAQGYVTAKHRLWQMEFQTHFAAGRISEIVGEKALPLDREARRKGMALAAEKGVEMMLSDEKMNEVVNAYSDGINAYISSLSKAELPLEYKLLDYEPEEWKPIKSAFLLKYMANNLSIHNSDFEYTNARKVFGEEVFNFLYPNAHSAVEPIVDKTGKWDFMPDTVATPKVRPFVLEELQKNPFVDEPDIRNGSNNWAVSGSKTKSGNPILCGDPHLGLNLPSIWFAMQLTAPGINVKGATLPGSPNVIIGFNDNVAWSVTNALRDVVDWYKIEYKDADRAAYLMDGEWKATETRIEEIKLKGAPTFYDTLMVTEWGPVMYDASYPAKSDENAYAIRWIAHDPSLEVKTFYLLNRAENYKDYREALKYYDCPAQNFAFASTEGDVAIVVQGKFPVKWKEQGKFLMDGSKSSGKWQEYIPMEQNVFSLNPARGFVSSANQDPVDSTYPYYVYSQSYETYRNRRINYLLDSLQDITVEDMMMMQNDNFNTIASDNLPFMLKQIKDKLSSDEEIEIYNLLASWDYINDIDAVAAAYFEEWYDAIPSLIWDEIRMKKSNLDYPNRFHTMEILRTDTTNQFLDIKSTSEKEDAKAIVNLAFKEGIKNVKEHLSKTGLKTAVWADYKSTSVTHLARLPAFSEEPIMIGGNHNIINATSGTHGASWRIIVELDKAGPIAKGIYPGGQSGNPGSPYYINYISKWASGEYLPFNLIKKDSDLENKLGVLTLDSKN